jgi:signal transduction histidine kinase
MDDMIVPSGYGIGITAEMLPRIFEMPDEPARAAGRTRHRLSLVKGLVDLHGGSIGRAATGQARKRVRRSPAGRCRTARSPDPTE